MAKKSDKSLVPSGGTSSPEATVPPDLRDIKSMVIEEEPSLRDRRNAVLKELGLRGTKKKYASAEEKKAAAKAAGRDLPTV